MNRLTVVSPITGTRVEIDRYVSDDDLPLLRKRYGWVLDIQHVEVSPMEDVEKAIVDACVQLKEEHKHD